MGQRTTQVTADISEVVTPEARTTQVNTDVNRLIVPVARVTNLNADVAMGPFVPPPPPPAPLLAPAFYRVGKPRIRCGNVWDWCLENEYRLWRSVDWSQRSRCSIPRCWRDYDNPLHMIPEQGREFHQYGAIGVPAVPGVDTLIVQFDVPTGYDGIIYGVLCKYVGLGFVNGSGDLLWRFQMNRHWIKSLQAVPTELGDFSAYSQLDEFIRVYSGQTIRVYGWLSPASALVPAPDRRMIAAVQGWYYPVDLAR